MQLKQQRNKIGWSVNELAAFLEVNERTIRRWEYNELATPRAVTRLLDYVILELNPPERSNEI